MNCMCVCICAVDACCDAAPVAKGSKDVGGRISCRQETLFMHRELREACVHCVCVCSLCVFTVCVCSLCVHCVCVFSASGGSIVESSQKITHMG